jgi:hypothetical protein
MLNIACLLLRSQKYALKNLGVQFSLNIFEFRMDITDCHIRTIFYRVIPVLSKLASESADTLPLE